MSDPIVYDLEEALSGLPTEAGETPTPTPEPAPTPAPQADDPRLEAMREALRISESARQELAARVNSGQPAPQTPQPKWFSREEIAEMLNSDDPNMRMQAVEISQQQAIAQAARHFETRLGALTTSAVDTAKAEAKRLYPVEFELFGDQIQSFADQLPDKAALGNVQGWGHIVRFVRGDDSNIERLAEARAAQKAREAQRDIVPNSFVPTRTGAGGGFVLDDATRDIARTLVDAGIYKSVDEYVKDMKGFSNLSL